MALEDLNENLENAKESVKGINEETKFLIDSITSIGAKIAETIEDTIDELQGVDDTGAKIAKSFGRDIVKGITSLTKGLDKTIELQFKLNSGINIAQELDKERIKTQSTIQAIKTRIALLGEEENKQREELELLLDKEVKKSEELLNILDEQNTKRLRAIGITGNLAKGLENILRKTGFQDLAQSLNIKEAINNAVEFNEKTEEFEFDELKAFNNLRKNIIGSIKAVDIFALTFIAILKQAGKIDSELVSFQKNLMLSRGEAIELRQELETAAIASGTNLINTSDLVKAQQNFNELLGLQGEINTKNLETQTRLTKLVGISAESAANLQFFSEATGKDFNQQYSTLVGNTQQISAQYGVQLNQKQVLEEIGKTSSYNLIQFKGSTEELGKAVAEAKALGLTLEQIGKIQSNLVNFESSIRAELEAELFTNKQLNLERARFAALTNDISTLQNEIKEQVGDINDFQNMNFISQQKFAQALGMSVGEISDMLLLEEYRNANQSQINANLTEEQKKRLESLTAQEKFNETITKLQGILGDVVSGPLGAFLDLTGKILESTIGLGAVLGGIAVMGFAKLIASLRTIRSLQIGAAIASAWKSAFSGPQSVLTGGLAGAAIGAGLTALIMSSINSVDDMVSPGYGKRVLSGPEGTFAFNDKDTIVAGTDLLPSNTTNAVNNTAPTTTVSPNMAALEQKMDKLIAVVENALIPAVKQDKIFALDGKQFAVATAVSRS